MKKQTTKNPGKQRLKIYNSSIHQKRKSLSSPLDKSLIEKEGVKKLSVRKGDTVKIMVGKYKGKTGKVEKVDYTKSKVFLKEIKTKNVRGQEKMVPFVASNLLITDLILTDLKRIKNKKTPKKVKVDGK
jgi:large subunit ribosomal protein L24